MSYKTGFSITTLAEKCGKCENYIPLIRFDRRMGFDIEYCRGKCSTTRHLRQRTDPKCKKFKELKVEVI